MDDDAQLRTHVWPALVYGDAPAAIRFLHDAFGFVEALVITNETDDRVIEHAELRWPEGGGVMLGSANRPGNAFSQRPTGVASVYVVTSDPDGVHDRAVANGAVVVSPLVEQDDGGRGFTVTDPEGNSWSFGSYPGEPL
jgi:uncharacterized glyoxalase superfamily protein PhnB